MNAHRCKGVRCATLRAVFAWIFLFQMTANSAGAYVLGSAVGDMRQAAGGVAGVLERGERLGGGAGIGVGAGGREDYEALGIHGDGRATVLRALVSSSADGAARVVGALAARGLDPSAATAAELFGPSSPAGAEETFRASRPVVVVVGAPVGEAVVDGGVPASDPLHHGRSHFPRTHHSHPGYRHESHSHRIGA